MREWIFRQGVNIRCKSDMADTALAGNILKVPVKIIKSSFSANGSDKRKQSNDAPAINHYLNFVVGKIFSRPIVNAGRVRMSRNNHPIKHFIGVYYRIAT